MPKPSSSPTRRPARKRSARSRLTRDEIAETFARLRQLNPKPTTELEFSSPYELLVAVTLSAQATDVGVNKATRKLFPVANTPRQIATSSECPTAPGWRLERTCVRSRTFWCG